MPPEILFDEPLVRRLPLPLAQLYRRAHNAKTPQDRHLAAFLLWEAALKLLGCVAVVAYVERGQADPDLAACLQNLARPSLGHWWELVRRLTPVLAEAGDPGFVAVRDLVLGRTRDDWPRVAGLDAALLEALEGRGGARATVRLTELFDRLVRYRNRELGHGAAGQQTSAFYERMGRALLGGVGQLLDRVDVLGGRQLLYIGDVRKQTADRWLIDRYELRGEVVRRLEALDLAESDAPRRLQPEQLYLQLPMQGLQLLYPFAIYDSEMGEVLFLNGRRGRKRIEYLSYNSGRFQERDDLAGEQRLLLAGIFAAPDSTPPEAPSEPPVAVGEAPGEPPVATGTPPGRLGEFELLSELGRGGMGVVYRAWQPSLGRQVAVKRVFQTGDPRAEGRFNREIRAFARVEHPHLVKIFTSGSEGEFWFYAMELVEGATLAGVHERLGSGNPHPETVDLLTWQQTVSSVCAEARRAEKPLSSPPGGTAPVADAADAPAGAADAPGSPGMASLVPHFGYARQVAELGRQVAWAAHALHEAGILHRDIKPGNILVNAEGTQAMLMDLGLAQIADEVQGKLTRTRQFIGTLRYASPEQVLAVGGLDRRSDVYNLGATLWELLTLRPLFGATEATPTPELMRRIQVEEVERPRKYHPGLSRDLEAVVLKCLEKDARQRYATAAELAQDLERYQHGEPVRARPVRGLERSWKWVKRRPVLAGLTAALLLVTVLGVAGIVWKYLDAEEQRKYAETQKGVALQAEKATKARQLLVSLFEQSESKGAGGTLTSRQMLDRAERRIHSPEFAVQGELKTQLLKDIETIYASITATAPLAMILEARGTVQLHSTRNPKQRALPQALLYNGDRLTLAADAEVQLVVLSDLHQERLRPGTEATVRRKGCEPADALLERTDDELMTFVPLLKGTFYMGWGSFDNEGTMIRKGVKTEIPEDFEIAVHDVTQGQWQAVMGENPSYFSRFGAGRKEVKDISDEELKLFPVESVSWDNAQEFIQKLNEKNRNSGWLYRLPTEAEWEYACRGGATSEEECSYHFYFDKPTNDLFSEQANFDGNFPFGKAPKGKNLGRPMRVGEYPSNKLGLCDMHGNVWQWCADDCDAKEKAVFGATTVGLLGSGFDQWPLLAVTEIIPKGRDFPEGSDRVAPGASWYGGGTGCRAANRLGSAADGPGQQPGLPSCPSSRPCDSLAVNNLTRG